MEKEFVPYQPSLDLKELGFDGECLGVYDSQTKELFLNDTRELSIKEIPTIFTLAPLYQQAFRWFREKYNQHCFIHYHSKPEYTFAVYNDIEMYWTLHKNISFNTYEEAELACLKKLIEIVKNK